MGGWSVMDWLVVMCSNMVSVWVNNLGMVSYWLVMWLHWLLIMMGHNMVWSWRRVVVDDSVMSLWKVMSGLWMWV